jgi:hypothetical protein
MSDIWCFQCLIARPDYKRPCAQLIVRHFSTESEAIDAKNEVVAEFYADNDISKEIPIDELDEWVYSDAYMEMPPIDFKIYKVDLKK